MTNNIEISKIILVAGIPGARMDFTAGWLGKLPGFIDNQWTVNTGTGLSWGFQGFTKILDHGTTSLEALLEEFKFKIVPNAQLMCAGSFHAHTRKNFESAVNNNIAEILTIDTTTANHPSITWEFYVKTYLTQNKIYSGCLENTAWAIDRQLSGTEITDVHRAREIHKRLCQETKKAQVVFEFYPDIPHKSVDYNTLFCAGGSKHLTDVLGLTVDQRYHQFWDAMLPFTASPDEIEAFGKIWRKSDYFPE